MAMGQDELLGAITLFAGNFAPRGTALCEGQLLPISQNSALFSILGTTYGGDGRTTFALPDLRGRVPMGYGNGPGLTPRRLGQRGGSETTTLTAAELPSHTHTAVVGGSGKINVGGSGDTHRAVGNALGFATGGQEQIYTSTPLTGSMANGTVDPTGITVTNMNTGSNRSFSNIQPFLVLNYIIALVGIFPSRS